MPPKRPPPLPKSLFMDNGPLSPAMAPHMPSPSSVHPEYITDAHYYGTHLALSTGDAKVIPPLKAVVGVDVGGVSVEAGEVSQEAPHPELKHRVPARLVGADDTSVDNPTDEDVQNHVPAVDLVLPNTTPLTEAQWDKVDEEVNRCDGGFRKVEGEGDVGDHTKILVSGLLPPPLTKPSSPLPRSPEYNLHCARLAQLSLHRDVVLKALPPVVDTRVAGPGAWWENEAELERVIKVYVAPAIETFGTHRIIFGSSPALPPTDPAVVVPVSGAMWYRVLRKVISEFGEDGHAMTGIMGSNALGAYDLH